jgi:O-antigen/teichoic acid export membrane protein
MLTGGLLGTVFALVAPHLSSELRLLGSGFDTVLLCATTVSLTAAGLVVDLALIGVLRGDLQFARNVIMAAAKLGLLVAVAVLPLTDRGLAIYFSWFGGTLVSFIAVAGFRRLPAGAYRPQWTLLRRLGSSALQHHALNLSLQIPALLMPLIVTVFLSATTNAYFYVASMISGLVYVVPVALSTALYAAGSHEPATFARKIRLTLGLSFVTGTLANAFLLVAAEPLLGIFGRAYAQQVATVLQLMALGVFPGMIKIHFVAVCQTHKRVQLAAVLAACGAVTELVAGAAGARLDGLTGLVLGFLLAGILEAVVVAPVVVRALLPGIELGSNLRWLIARHGQ